MLAVNNLTLWQRSCLYLMIVHKLSQLTIATAICRSSAKPLRQNLLAKSCFYEMGHCPFSPNRPTNLSQFEPNIMHTELKAYYFVCAALQCDVSFRHTAVSLGLVIRLYPVGCRLKTIDHRQKSLSRHFSLKTVPASRLEFGVQTSRSWDVCVMRNAFTMLNVKE